jgi:hypothetical protein
MGLAPIAVYGNASSAGGTRKAVDDEIVIVLQKTDPTYIPKRYLAVLPKSYLGPSVPLHYLAPHSGHCIFHPPSDFMGLEADEGDSPNGYVGSVASDEMGAFDDGAMSDSELSLLASDPSTAKYRPPFLENHRVTLTNPKPTAASLKLTADNIRAAALQPVVGVTKPNPKPKPRKPGTGGRGYSRKYAPSKFRIVTTRRQRLKRRTVCKRL